MMQLDSHASVKARDSIMINAPIQKVWAIQTDFENWSSWQPDVQQVRLDGDIKQGTRFYWKAQGLNIKSILQAVEAPHLIGWTGTSLGMRAVHIWHFEETLGGTIVTTEESLSGWLTRLLSLLDNNFLQKSMAKSLTILKDQAEKIE